LKPSNNNNGLHTRRSALKTIAGGLLTASGLDQLVAGQARAKPEDAPGKYKIFPWTGDDFTLGHRLRDKKFDHGIRTPETSVDFVIVGGGIAGLAAAHYLKNHDYILLEQYGSVGGQALGSGSANRGFSYGSTWLNSIDGASGELIDSLSLKTRQLEAFSSAWLWENNWTSFPGESEKSFSQAMETLLDSCGDQIREVDQSFAFGDMNDSTLADLDKLAFDEAATFQSEQFQDLINNYFRSVACCDTKKISALGGAKLLRSLSGKRYTLCGGNQRLAEALKAEATALRANALVINAFVWEVQVQEAGALVTYSDGAGQLHTILAKHVIVTAPPMVASRLLTNLNNSDRIPLLKFHYGSYLVGNVDLEAALFDFGYQGYTKKLSGLAEIDIVEYGCQDARANKGQRLTLKQPFESSSEGRSLLLEGNQEELAQALLDQLQACVPGKALAVKSITLSRWGHAIAAPVPGYYAIAAKIAAQDIPGLSLAHCSTAGIASVEAAVEAARRAADRALGRPAKKSISYSI